MPTVKLLVCYHKPDTLLQDSVFTPIHVGRALAKKRWPEGSPTLSWMTEKMIGDDTGENISEKNASYNELTALYWAWKNYDQLGNPDFIGLMHYRRHFVFREGEVRVYTLSGMGGEHYLEELNYSPEKLQKMLEDCDFACHLGKVDGIYRHYLDNHRQSDLDLALKLVCDLYPEYAADARAYMEQSVGNFCNMFLFPRKLFFEYCRWIFRILEEFEKQVDISEKRLFISERLTGIFIYHLMQKGLRYKVFPIAFVAEPIEIPVAMPMEQENLFPLAVSIVSMLKTAKPGTRYAFYLMDSQKPTEKTRQAFEQLEKAYPIASFHFLQSGYRPEYYPLELSELIPQVRKCIYCTPRILAMQDLAEFFRTCSVDDYYVCGLPLNGYGKGEKAIESEVLTLHCERLRKYRILEQCQEGIGKGEAACDLLNHVCKGQIGYFPYWFTTLAKDVPKEELFPAGKPRSQYQQEALYRPLLDYGAVAPWVDSQGMYSHFWWNIATHVPAPFQFRLPQLEKVESLYASQQKQINRVGQLLREAGESVRPGEDPNWQRQPLAVKAKAYYRQFGLRKSLQRVREKVFGGE